MNLPHALTARSTQGDVSPFQRRSAPSSFRKALTKYIATRTSTTARSRLAVRVWSRRLRVSSGASPRALHSAKPLNSFTSASVKSLKWTLTDELFCPNGSVSMQASRTQRFSLALATSFKSGRQTLMTSFAKLRADKRQHFAKSSARGAADEAAQTRGQTGSDGPREAGRGPAFRWRTGPSHPSPSARGAESARPAGGGTLH